MFRIKQKIEKTLTPVLPIKFPKRLENIAENNKLKINKKE